MRKYLGVLGLLAAILLFFFQTSPVFALTTADVFINATGEFVAIAVAPGTYDFGAQGAGAVDNTTTSEFTITNTSSVAITCTVKVIGDWTGVGTPWTAADDGQPGNNIAGLYAYSPDTTTWEVIIKKSAAFNELVHNKAAMTDFTFGVGLNAPTIFTDGAHNQNTVRVTAAKH